MVNTPDDPSMTAGEFVKSQSRLTLNQYRSSPPTKSASGIGVVLIIGSAFPFECLMTVSQRNILKAEQRSRPLPHRLWRGRHDCQKVDNTETESEEASNRLAPYDLASALLSWPSVGH